jgi:hypothetical protein
MADVTIFSDHHVATGKAVEDAAVLDVGTGNQLHLAEVTS